jgi:hypothetical protein
MERGDIVRVEDDETQAVEERQIARLGVGRKSCRDAREEKHNDDGQRKETMDHQRITPVVVGSLARKPREWATCG